MPGVEAPEENLEGGGEGEWEGKELVHDRDPLADGGCSQMVLDFLSTTDVGRLVLAEEDTVSEVTEWEHRERREREEESRVGAEELGAAGDLGAGEELPLLLPRPPSCHSQMRIVGWGYYFSPLVRAHFLCYFLGVQPSLGKGQGGGHPGACNVAPPRRYRNKKCVVVV